MDVLIQLATILATLLATLFGLWLFLERADTPSTWFATSEPKRSWERASLLYGIVWVLCFAAIIYDKMYLWFDEWWYFGVLFGLCVPLFVYPWLRQGAEERTVPVYLRFSFKANVWIAVFSFIGNYWYTHYFYSVLKAKYTFPSWRLNDVPLCLYFATFFYFSLYHAGANLILRKTWTHYKPSAVRTVYTLCLVCTMAYSTALTETITISGFPYYSFEDRSMAMTVGSAFYGLYFVVSYPMFFRLDEPARAKANARGPQSNRSNNSDSDVRFDLLQTFCESLASGMAVLTLLDAVRLWLGIPLTIAG